MPLRIRAPSWDATMQLTSPVWPFRERDAVRGILVECSISLRWGARREATEVGKGGGGEQ